MLVGFLVRSLLHRFGAGYAGIRERGKKSEGQEKQKRIESELKC